MRRRFPRRGCSAYGYSPEGQRIGQAGWLGLRRVPERHNAVKVLQLLHSCRADYKVILVGDTAMRALGGCHGKR